MVKSKKQMFIVISVFALVMLLGTTTYAFFNYTRTGSANTISVGRINFITRQTETINLSNVFPIDRSAIDTDTDNVDEVVIEIEGDTDYSEGIEYLVSSVDSEIYTSTGKLVPISLDVTVDDLGSASPTYFTARESTNTSIYKKLVGGSLVGDQMLLVGYIVPNTTLGTASGIDGSITIKAFFDKDVIAISDTYDGTESDYNGTTNEWVDGRTVLTTTEWNNLNSNGVSFKIKVEANQGIWVTGSLEEIMKKTAVMDNVASTYVSSSSGVIFYETAGDTNGKGVYTRAGTENNEYPIMYYRGDVTDNNVLFANYCWKVVRTTDTGGVKLLYNGEPKQIKRVLTENDYSIITNTGSMTFDSTENVWVIRSNDVIGTNSSPLEISFGVPSGDGYELEVFGNGGYNVTVSMHKGVSGVYTRLNGWGAGHGDSFTAPVLNYGTMTSDDTMKIEYYGSGTSEQEAVIKIRVSYEDNTLGIGCNNRETDTLIKLKVNGTDTTSFTYSGTYMNNSPTYVGYMYGNVYTQSSSNWTTNAKFGSGFVWDGSNYTLTDATVTTPDNTHHYSCNSADATATCASLRYVFQTSGSYKYYITLTGGKGVEQAITEMKTNVTNSNAKSKVDEWYAANLTSFTSKLEDAIYCSDRSKRTNSNNGWTASGGNISQPLYFGAYGRRYMGIPSLDCVNKNDSFTWKNSSGNQQLTYPVGLLTVDEMMIAGADYETSNANLYIVGGAGYVSMSPSQFYNGRSDIFSLNYDGGYYENSTSNSYGIRPVITIKPGTSLSGGDGTVNNPFVIE